MDEDEDHDLAEGSVASVHEDEDHHLDDEGSVAPVYDCDGNNVHDLPPGYYNCSVRELRARIEASRP